MQQSLWIPDKNIICSPALRQFDKTVLNNLVNLLIWQFLATLNAVVIQQQQQQTIQWGSAQMQLTVSKVNFISELISNFDL